MIFVLPDLSGSGTASGTEWDAEISVAGADDETPSASESNKNYRSMSNCITFIISRRLLTNAFPRQCTAYQLNMVDTILQQYIIWA